MVTLALVGAGSWGKNLLRNFASIPGCRLKWVCDRDEAILARAAAAAPGARSVQDLAAVVTDAEVQAIAIATPARTHHDVAKICLEAGKDVFVEKPLALTVEDGEDLLRCTRARGRLLMVGHLLHYHPAVEKLKEVVAAEAGRIHCIYTQRLNLGVIRKDENAWWSLAPHDVSVVLSLLGGALPSAVTARGGAFVQPAVEDVVFATLDFPGGEIANIHVSWLDPHKVRTMTVVGSRRMVTFDDQEPAEKIRIYEKGAHPPQEFASFGESIGIHAGEVRIPQVRSTEPLREECLHFLRCVEERKPPRTDGDEGLRVLKVLAAAQTSLERGGTPVRVS